MTSTHMSLRQSAMQSYNDLSRRSAQQFDHADMDKIQHFADSLSDDGAEIPDAGANTFALHYGDDFPRHYGVPEHPSTNAKRFRRQTRKKSPARRSSPKWANTRVCPLAIMYGDNLPREPTQHDMLPHNHAEPVNFELLSSYDEPRDQTKQKQDGNSEYELKDNWEWTNNPNLNRPVREQQFAVDEPVNMFKRQNQPGYQGDFEITSTDDYMRDKSYTEKPDEFLDVSQHYY